jgi:hypothetical protein
MHTQRYRSLHGITILILVFALTGCFRPVPVSRTSTPAQPLQTTAPGTVIVSPAATGTLNTAPAPSAGPTALSTTNVAYQDVSFRLPAAVASSASGRTAPATDILGETYPAHVEFSLTGYPSSNTAFEPLIRVYPVSELGVVAASTGQQLKELLSERPTTLPATLPLLPALPAGQLVHAGIRYLSFENGSGVRMLTQFAQDSWPVNNEGLVYVFQGLTRDERYYISAFLPVSAAFLPDKVNDPDTVPAVDGVPYPKADSDDFGIEYARYQQAVAGRLESAGPGEFEPSPQLLDALIQSLLAGSGEGASEDVVCAGAPPTRLRVDGFAYVEPEPPLPNNVRRDAGKDNPLVGEIEAGAAMRILEGPKCADGWLWWRVQALESDVEGWTTEGDQQSYWLVPCESQNECKP